MILEDRIRGSLIGLAIGDAMGTPVRGLSPEDIESKYGKVSYFVPREEYNDYGHISELTKVVLHYSNIIIKKEGQLENNDFLNALVSWGNKQKEYNKWSINDPLLLEFILFSDNRKNLVTLKPYRMSIGGVFPLIPLAIINAGLLQTTLHEIVRYSSTLYDSNIGIAGSAAIGCALAIALDPTTTTIEGVIEAAIFGAEEGQKFGYHVTSYNLAKRIKDAVELAKKLKQQGYELLDAFKEITSEFGNSFLINEVIPSIFGLLYLRYDSPLSARKTAVNAGGETGVLGGLIGMLSGAVSGIDKIPDTIVRVVLEKNNLKLSNRISKMVEMRNRNFLK